MSQPKIMSQNEACILAVDALDNIVNDIVKASKMTPSPGFLDWVADEATPLVELAIAKSFGSQRFINSLQMGHPKIALMHWVLFWVRPEIVAKFVGMSKYLPKIPEGGLIPLVKPVSLANVAASLNSYAPKQNNLQPRSVTTVQHQ